MSLTWTVNCHEARGANECLRRVTIWSDSTRNPSGENFYYVRVGIGRQGKVDWIGTYDGSSQKLEARKFRDLTGSVTVDRILAEGETLLVEVQRSGSPLPSAVGLTVEWHLERVGGNSQRPAALFQMAGWIPDGSVRGPVEGVVGQLNNSGVAGWTVPVYLSDPAVESIAESYPRVVDVDDATELFSNSAAEQTVYSHTVPAGTLSQGRSYRLLMYGVWLNNTGSNQTITLKVKYGATTLFDDITGAIATGAAYRWWRLAVTLSANGSVSAQTFEGAFSLSDLTVTTAGVGNLTGAAILYPAPFGGVSTIDGTADRDFVVTWTNSAASTSLGQYIYLRRLELA